MKSDSPITPSEFQLSANVRRALKNVVAGARTFYVKSESSPTDYTVVEIKRGGTFYFCNCMDFFTRKLPFLGTNLMSHCKHINAVKEAIANGKSV